MDDNAQQSSGRRVKRWIFAGIAFIVIAFLTFGSSVYAKNVLNPTELVHFFVPFPAGKVFKPGTVIKPDGGAVFVKPFSVDVQKQGVFKRIVNPYIVDMSTHWLINVDSKPHRIGLKLTDSEIPIEWEVGGAIPWDPVKREFTEAVQPGEQIADLGIDWLFHIPENIRSKPVWYDGALTVFDADTQEVLTTIPIKFLNGSTSAGGPPIPNGRPSTSDPSAPNGRPSTSDPPTPTPTQASCCD